MLSHGNPRGHAATPPSVSAHEEMVRKEIAVLLQTDRDHVPCHPALVNATRVCYGDVFVPLTKQKGKMFFLVSPDLCEVCCVANRTNIVIICLCICLVCVYL